LPNGAFSLATVYAAWGIPKPSQLR